MPPLLIMGTFGMFDPITLNCQGHVTNHSEAAGKLCVIADWLNGATRACPSQACQL